MRETEYGQVATLHESPSECRTLFEEVEEYFDTGAQISQGDTVVDVGANIGAFAVAAAKRCSGKLKIFCFEPVPPLFQTLQQNLRENDWLKDGKHRAFNIALSMPGDAKTKLPFYYFRRFPRDSTMDIEGKRREFEAFFAAQGKKAGQAVSFLGPGAKLVEKTVAWLPHGKVGQWFSDRATGLEVLEVPCDTMSSVLDKESVERIDLLKVDVEGHESKVLGGIQQPTWDRIRQAVIESDGAEHNTTGLLELLKSRGLSDTRVFLPPTMVERGMKNVIIYAKRPAATA